MRHKVWWSVTANRRYSAGCVELRFWWYHKHDVNSRDIEVDWHADTLDHIESNMDMESDMGKFAEAPVASAFEVAAFVFYITGQCSLISFKIFTRKSYVCHALSRRVVISCLQYNWSCAMELCRAYAVTTSAAMLYQSRFSSQLLLLTSVSHQLAAYDGISQSLQ